MRYPLICGRVPSSVITSTLLFLLCLTALLGFHLSAHQPLTEHEQIHTITEDGHTYESNGIIFLAAEDTIQRTWGRHKLVLRAVPEVSAWLTIVLVFLIGRELGGPKVGLCSAFMLMSSTWMLAIGAHARFYSLNLLCITAATLFLLKALRTARSLWWTLYLIAILGAIGTMITSITVLIFHGLLAFLAPIAPRRPQSRWFFALVGLLAIISFAALTWRDHEAMTRLTYAPLSLRTFQEQAELFIGAGITRCHFPEYYSTANDGSGAPLLSGVIALQLLLAIVLVRALGMSWSHSLARFAPAPTARHQNTLRASERHYGRCLSLAWLVTWALPRLYVLGKGQNILNDSSFTWQLPLVAILLGSALAHQRYWRWAALTALFILSPLACQATYMHGCGNEHIVRWLQEHTTSRDTVMLDSVTLRDLHRILPEDCAADVLRRLTVYVQPLGVRSEITAVGDFEEYRLRNALRQVPSSSWRNDHRLFIVTDHKSAVADPVHYEALIIQKAREYGGTAQTLVLYDGRLHGLCIYMIRFQKLAARSEH